MAAAWGIFCRWAWRAAHNPRGDVTSGIVWSFARVYARVWHGLRVVGRHHVPPRPVVNGRPVLVVANHSAGVDPVLIQAALPWYVRFMMAADMRAPAFEDFWQFAEVIFLDRSGKADVGAFRTALGVMAAGNALGIFPEGKLRRSRNELNPFLPGIGLLIAKGNALVLPVVITGTPLRRETWHSLVFPSRSTVEFKPLVDFRKMGLKPGEYAARLREMYAKWMAESGYAPEGVVEELNDQGMPETTAVATA
ncbi:hypothetical protein BH11PLA1_BH11PLA1_22440 [soil metagenome]